MKKKTKNNIVLASITIFLGIYLSYEFYKGWKLQKIKEIESINTPAFDIAPENVNSFKIINTKFFKRNNSWFIESTENIPADNLKVSFFLNYLHNIKKIKVVERKPSINYGFKKATIALNNSVYTLGGNAFNTGTIYLRHPSGTIFLISSEIRKHFKTKIVYWFRKEIPVPIDNISKLTLLSDAKRSMFFNLENINEEWFYINSRGKRFAASEASVKRLFKALKNLRASMILFENLINKKNEKTTLTIKSSNGEIEKIVFFKSHPQGFIDEACFYQRASSKLAYQVPCTVHKFLTRSRSYYIARTHFAITRQIVASIKIRSREYFFQITKHNEDHWDLDNKNVVNLVSDIFTFFDSLTVSNICVQKCNLQKDPRTMYLLKFYDDNSDQIVKFTFHYSGRKTWFYKNSEEIAYIIPYKHYDKLAKLIEMLGD